MSKNPKVYIGTSGWQYNDWGNDTFYPSDIPKKDWLDYYTSKFNTTEVNGTFYRLIKKETIDNWKDKAPQGFYYTIKMSRQITHFKKLKDCDKETTNFFNNYNYLPPKNGPLLIQLPPNLHKDKKRLENFLKIVKKAQGSKRWKLALEFRHKSWFENDIFKLADKYNAAVCLSDFPDAENDKTNTDSSFIYIRRHGTKGKYEGSYSKQKLKKDAKIINSYIDEGKSVYFYFNNDKSGDAPIDAQNLKKTLS